MRCKQFEKRCICYAELEQYTYILFDDYDGLLRFNFSLFPYLFFAETRLFPLSRGVLCPRYLFRTRFNSSSRSTNPVTPTYHHVTVTFRYLPRENSQKGKRETHTTWIRDSHGREAPKARM